MSSELIYKEKITRLNKAFNKETPDRIPIMPNIETWMYHYAGISLKRAFTESPEILFQGIKKFTDDVYVDGIFGVSNSVPVKLFDKIGNSLYVVTEDSLQTKGSAGQTMAPNEYSLLAENPMKFFAEKILPRKYPIFTQSPEKNLELLRQLRSDFNDFGSYNGSVIKRIREELGMPVLTKTAIYVTPDIILDYLRDFVGTIQDIKRNGKAYLESCLSLFEMTIQQLWDSGAIPDEHGFIFSPLHLPTFLNKKDFAKYYLPFMKKMVEEIGVKRGFTILFFMENDWTPYLDLLQELPDAKIVGLFEHGNLEEIKKSIGNKMTIAGGMPINLLKHGSKEQCIDQAKKCIDTLAPGGNYIFAIDMVLMAMNDAKPENVIATFDYVRDNGKY